MKNILSIRREYGDKELLEKNIKNDPFKQFEHWLQEAVDAKILDPTAMVLATIDNKGMPDARVVLLKGFDNNGFTFFTNYTSPKSIQAESHGFVALNFYWPELARQIRIKGAIKRIPREETEAYFSSRPRDSQIAAYISKQSTVISSREELEKRFIEVTKEYHSKEIPCPKEWGGYRVSPLEFEFFQGRDNRLNDRIRYLKVDHDWKIERLAP